ncbi:MAG: uracil-DNA glycosylase [Chlamydiota bacterium]|nr:uracil-DNA glycosylase [Chlamydiota bacterium]
MLLNQIDASWQKILLPLLALANENGLNSFLYNEERGGRVIFPSHEKRLRAFHLTPYSLLKGVIVGQDPYHRRGQAEGLAFSVPKGVPPPPSLKNILKEVASDCGTKIGKGGSLVGWARQGVLLLNTLLTVREGEPLSHRGKGWEAVTHGVIRTLLVSQRPLFFMLWGRESQKVVVGNSSPHLILRAGHPSPLSCRHFLGCRHFSQANRFLEERGREGVDWSWCGEESP